MVSGCAVRAHRTRAERHDVRITSTQALPRVPLLTSAAINDRGDRPPSWRRRRHRVTLRCLRLSDGQRAPLGPETKRAEGPESSMTGRSPLASRVSVARTLRSEAPRVLVDREEVLMPDGV